MNMPVTKSAKRALRGSVKKQKVNRAVVSKLEVSVRKAKKSKTQASVNEAASLADRAVKTRAIHRNKAARIKSVLAKLTAKKK